MPVEHSNQMIDEVIERILNGKGSSVTLLEVVQSRNATRIASYLRVAVAPVIAKMEDDIDIAREQRNKAREQAVQFK